MTPYLLMGAGALLVLAALAGCFLPGAGPWLLGLATAGCLTVGGGELASGAWPGTISAWLVAGYLGWQWNEAARKARRR